MKRLLFFAAVLVTGGTGSLFGDDGWVSIFDGKTLKGWEESPVREEKAWEVRDGVIVGDGNKGGRGYLVYENRELADFELKFSYRFEDKGNSGVNIRAVKDETGKRDYKSYHVDLGHVGIGKQVLGAWDFHTPGRKEHRCFRGERLVIGEDDEPTLEVIEGAVETGDINKGGWNEVHVVAKGNRFWFSINGKLASEFTEHLPEEKRLKRGMIQLQLHDPGMVVSFRELKLKVTE